MNLNIDIVGACNLRCPSCPVGNSQAIKNPKGAMSLDLFEEILIKAKRETHVHCVSLFNWTEPFIHPRLPEFVRMLKKHDLISDISSNLNLNKNIEEVMAENPFNFRVSVSGFSQDTYALNHKGGDIEAVKNNMARLAQAKQRCGATTRLEVLYHRYIGNMDDEFKMKVFSEALGFEFVPVWATMGPLEKVLALAYGSSMSITKEDMDVVNRLALPMGEAIQASVKHKHLPCTLRDQQITMDWQGNVTLCCGLYETQAFSVGSFLEAPLEELQQRKSTLKICRDTCSLCMNKGLHVYGTYRAPEFNSIASVNVIRHYAGVLGVGVNV